MAALESLAMLSTRRSRSLTVRDQGSTVSGHHCDNKDLQVRLESSLGNFYANLRVRILGRRRCVVRSSSADFAVSG